MAVAPSPSRKEYIYGYHDQRIPRNASHVIVQVNCRSIGWRAFDGFVYLQQVSFVGVDDLQIICSLAFWGCTSLRSIALPTSVTRIDEGAFERCCALQEVHLPNGLRQIADSTFYGCTSLEFIAIPPMVRKIGKFAFAYCQALREIQFASATDGGRLGVIGSCSFMKCKSLKKAAIPSTVFSIGQSAFEGCTRLQELILHFDNETLQGSPLNIHLRAFQNCVRLYLVTLPKALRVMDKTAFHNCKNLNRLDLPPSFQLKSFQNGWPLIKQVLVTTVPTYSHPWDLELWEQLKLVCSRGKSAVRKQRVYALAKQMRDCRRIEITSLLELALWKKAIFEEQKLRKKEDCDAKTMADRSKYRITCGAYVVMQNVVEYLISSKGDSSSDMAATAITCSIRGWNVSEF